MVVWRIGFFLLLLGLPIGTSFGEADIGEPEPGVDTDIPDSTSGKNEEEPAAIGADAEITGIVIINGSVWIDGVKIHKPQSAYISRKSGKKYHIHWSSNDNVSVTEE